MRTIRMTYRNMSELGIRYSDERDDSWIPEPGNSPYLMRNPESKGDFYYVDFAGVRISDYMTKEEARALCKTYKWECMYKSGVDITFLEEGYVDRNARIVSCEIVKGQFENEVVVVNTEGDKYIVLTYYPDELHFSASEFIGLTGHGALELFRRKDVAYLRA